MNRWRVVEVIDDDDYWLFRASSGPTLSFDSFDSHVANIRVENIAGIYRCVQCIFKCLESWCQVAVRLLNVKHVKIFKDARWVMPVFQYIHIYNICCSNVIFFSLSPVLAPDRLHRPPPHVHRHQPRSHCLALCKVLYLILKWPHGRNWLEKVRWSCQLQNFLLFDRSDGKWNEIQIRRSDPEWFGNRDPLYWALTILTAK